MKVIDADVLEQLPLERVRRVIFYKQEKIASDEICCDVEVDGAVWSFHEEQRGWELLLAHLLALPGFRQDWFPALLRLPSAENGIVAFTRET